MKTWKTRPQKLLIIGPKFFFSTGPAAQTSLELIFHIINMSQDSSVYWSVVEIELKTQFQVPTCCVHCKITLDDLEFAKPSLIYFPDLSDSKEPFDYT